MRLRSILREEDDPNWMPGVPRDSAEYRDPPPTPEELEWQYSNGMATRPYDPSNLHNKRYLDPDGRIYWIWTGSLKVAGPFADNSGISHTSLWKNIENHYRGVVYEGNSDKGYIIIPWRLEMRPIPNTITTALDKMFPGVTFSQEIFQG